MLRTNLKYIDFFVKYSDTIVMCMYECVYMFAITAVNTDV